MYQLQIARNMKRKEEIDNASYECTGEYTNYEFHCGAEWSDEHPSKNNIAKYLSERGWPVSTNGVITYEDATKSMQSYYEYKRKQWIDRACEFIKENTALESEFYIDFRKVMENK